MADKDQSQSKTGEEMEEGLKLPSEQDYEEVNEMLSKTKLDLESEKEAAQLTETPAAAAEEECHAIMSCSKTMLTFTEQASLLRDVADISNSLTSQSHDQSSVKQTGENDNKQLAEKYLQLPNEVGEYLQQIEQTFADQLRFLQSSAFDYDSQFNQLGEIFGKKSSMADQTAENVKQKLAVLRGQHENFIEHLRELNNRILDVIRKGKAEIKTKEEELKKIFKELKATNQVRAHKFEIDVKQVESENDKLESELQKQFSKILSILSDMEINLLKSKQLIEEFQQDCA